MKRRRESRARPTRRRLTARRLPWRYAAGRRTWDYLTAEQVEGLKPPPWIVPNIIPAESFVVLYGKPEVGKSFMALDLALSIATGKASALGQVAQGRVLYLAGEGAFGFRNRIIAWKANRGVKKVGLGFHLCRNVVNLMDDDDVSSFIESARGLAPSLVVVDTLARAMPGGDENSPKDMGIAVAQLDRIKRDLQCTVLVLHHPTKQGGTERGSGALRGAADTMLVLKRDKDKRTVSCEKQKDGPHFAPIAVTLATRRLSAGESSCVLLYRGGAESDAPVLKPQERAVLSLLRDGSPNGRRTVEWQKAAFAADVSAATFYRALAYLRLLDLVSREEPDSKTVLCKLTKKGVDALNSQ